MKPVTSTPLNWLRSWLALACLTGMTMQQPLGDDSAPTGELSASWIQRLTDTWQTRGYFETEGRAFLDSPVDPLQRDRALGLSFAANPELYRPLETGDLELTIEPFARWDSNDSNRSHADLRQFHLKGYRGDWEWQAGVGRVFWGVTETQHVVDVINQDDGVENIDTEDKLGQPMINLTRLTSYGDIDLYVLPYFRERTFPGPHGRLRPIPYVDTDRADYQSDLGQWHPDVALRWANALGDFDLGAYYFYGTSRDPLLRPIPAGGRIALQPVYNLMHQVGLDAQWTRAGWLLKLEGIAREGRGQHFQAAATGLEYTLYGLAGSDLDLGLLGEFHYQSEGKRSGVPFDEDLFIGGRLTWNDVQDTALLGGLFYDVNNQSRSARLEFSRRLGERYLLEAEFTRYLETDALDPLFSFRNESFFQLAIRRYF